MFLINALSEIVKSSVTLILVYFSLFRRLYIHVFEYWIILGSIFENHFDWSLCFPSFFQQELLWCWAIEEGIFDYMFCQKFYEFLYSLEHRRWWHYFCVFSYYSMFVFESFKFFLSWIQQRISCLFSSVDLTASAKVFLEASENPPAIIFCLMLQRFVYLSALNARSTSFLFVYFSRSLIAGPFSFNFFGEDFTVWSSMLSVFTIPSGALTFERSIKLSF